MTTLTKRALVFILSLATIAGVMVIFADTVRAVDHTEPTVKVINATNAHLDSQFNAYDKGFKGGGYIAVGNTDGVSKEEIIIGAGQGGGPHVRVLRSNGDFAGFSAFPFHPNYRGGVDVAAGDVDGDGKDEIIVGQASSGQAWVKVYEPNNDKTILAEFIAYDSGFEGGVHVAAGDINGDGKDEIITGSGIGSTSHVRSFDMHGNFNGLSLFPFEEGYRGGVDVAVGNVDGGRKSEVVVSKAYFGRPQVKVYKTDTGNRIVGDFYAYNEDQQEGVNIAAADIDKDGKAEIITGTAGNAPQIRTFEAYGKAKNMSTMAYSSDFRGGVRVAAGELDGKQSAREIVTMPGRRMWQGRNGIYKYIEVDLSEQRLRAFQGGRLDHEMRISSGTSAFPSPIGNFTISQKILSTRMAGYYGPGNPNNYDIPGVPHVLRFYGAYTIHGAFWHNNFGHPMSHGCINLSLSDAATIYNWAGIGDPVFIVP